MAICRPRIRYDCSSKTTQSMPQQLFEIGDQVVFIPDPVPTSERVIDIKWLDAPVPHWQVTTIWWIGGREFRGTAARYGLEFDRTPVGSTPLLVALVPTERPRSRDAQSSISAGDRGFESC